MSTTSVIQATKIKGLQKVLEPPLPYRFEDNLPTQVLEIDKKTNDNHVARDPELLRLTGSHPFNCEPPLEKLYDSGFLTPVSLHFVRNHGPVPQVPLDEGWEISIEGMVEKPYKLSLSEIIHDFECYTTPVTLVCAGNRRKEQNMVKKGTGFNWGAAGTSTSLWTGCMLWDVISKAIPSKSARFVWMEGGDQPANGAYGTCVRLSWVQDSERSILLSYKQNGQWLTPDHGKPLRVIIPGVIGGRSVKWLKRLVISDRPSDNWYHYFDNRLLPTMVTPEMSKKDENWWKDERYAIMDLNLQSVTCKPYNNEVLDVSKEAEYEIGGYAYNGGGVRVSRVEVSFDKGLTWQLAMIDYPEDLYRNAGYFQLFGGTVNVCDRMSCLCWCFWKLKVPTSHLLGAKEILVRAMDERMCIQPRNMYWNVTSMLNNWWYRVAIIPEGEQKIRFEHPVIANTAGGWMDRVKAEGGDMLDNNWGEFDDSSVAPVRKPPVDEDIQMMCDKSKMDIIISREELKAHENNEEHPWFAVKGHVFDGTSYLDEHPGGVQSILMVSGEDATEDFLAIHSSFAKKLLPSMHLGRLEGENKGEVGSSVKDQSVSRPTLLDPKRWHKITLAEKEIISGDSRIFKFDLEHPEQLIGLPTGKHLYLRLKNSSNKYVMRAYTPKSSNTLKGKLEILIKVYFPSKSFPEGSIMTGLIENLKLGENIEVKGPVGEFEYLFDGLCTFNGQQQKVKHFFMISGGSGITPTYQVLKAVLDKAPEDKTTIDLIFGNRTEEDILLRGELDLLAKNYPAQLRVDYILSDLARLPGEWQGLRGRISSSLLDSYIEDKISGEFMVLVCGPPGMNSAVEAWRSQRKIERNYVVYF